MSFRAAMPRSYSPRSFPEGRGGRLALLAALLLSAQTQAASTCSISGVDSWREYRSKHFLLDTDVSNFKAGQLIKDLENFQAMILQALLGEQVEIPGRIRVIALNDPGKFKDFAGNYWVGGYFHFTAFGEPSIVLPVAGLKASPEIVAHELAHHISWFLFPRQPNWFGEGLAQFVETVASLTEESTPMTGTHVHRGEQLLRGAGIMPRHMADEFRQTPSVPAKDLLEWRGRLDDASPGRYHLWSRLLYHWLWNHRSKQFTDFQRRLSEAEDPVLAWRVAFPEFDPDKPGALAKLDDLLNSYRKTARYVFYQVSAQSDASFTDSPLSSADVHFLLVDARWAWPEKEAGEALRRKELDEALREDPAQPFAIKERARLDKSSPIPALRKASAARPGDWRVWLSLGRALEVGTDNADKVERESAYRKAIQLNPDNAQAQNGLAWTLAEEGRAKEALPFANRAVDLAPWNPNILDTLGLVAWKLDKCPEALTLQRRSVALLDPREDPQDAVWNRLREYESRCGRASPPPAVQAMPTGK